LSGLVVVSSGLIDINIAGVQVSGTVAISGSVDIAIPSAVVINDTAINPQPITANSGGEMLTSAAIISVIVKACTSNADAVFIGGYNDQPNSGIGLEMYAGEAVNVDIDELGKVWACALTSGDKVSYLAVT